MTITHHPYHHPSDYKRIDSFLIEHYQPGNLDRNWVEPAWEYMHFHPAMESAWLERIGVWEENMQIVAVAHHEWHLGEVFFQFHPDYRHLRAELLDYAENHLGGSSREDARKNLRAYVNDNDLEFINLVRSRGYTEDRTNSRPMARFDIPEPFPAIPLPDGYHLTSLAEECDWAKIHRVLWRGFDHQGEPPGGEDELESRRAMFDTPKGQRDLKIAVVAPNGDFAAFCGTFFEPSGKFAYIEPVATDPAYRRTGLGKSAVLEGIRRCAALGAKIAYVGSDQQFYQAIGFTKIYSSVCWVKDVGKSSNSILSTSG